MQLIRVQKMDLNGVGGPWQELGWKVKGKSWRTKILVYFFTPNPMTVNTFSDLYYKQKFTF
jgi:hypothetical protein